MVNIFKIIVKFCGIYNSFSKKSKAELIIKDKFRIVFLNNILFLAVPTIGTELARRNSD